MWALKMKPLPKQRWETCFDRKIYDAKNAAYVMEQKTYIWEGEYL